MAKPKQTKPKATERSKGFTKVMVERISERLADGESLRFICLSDKMPSKTMVFRWLRQFNSFRDQYARERRRQTPSLTRA